MSDTGTPSETTAPHADDIDADESCKPLGLDFDGLAAVVTTKHAERGTPKTLRSVEHTLGHLREETGLGDRQIARVLLTVSYLLGELASTAGTNWSGIATTNWLSTCGARLWNEGGA